MTLLQKIRACHELSELSLLVPEKSSKEDKWHGNPKPQSQSMCMSRRNVSKCEIIGTTEQEVFRTPHKL